MAVVYARHVKGGGSHLGWIERVEGSDRGREERIVVVVEVKRRASGRDESRGNRSDDRRSPERVRGAIEQLPHPSGVSNLTIMIYLTQASTTNILIHFGMRRRSPLRLRRSWIIVAVRRSL